MLEHNQSMGQAKMQCQIQVWLICTAPFSTKSYPNTGFRKMAAIPVPGSPQFSSNPEQALQQLAGATTQAQDNTAAESMVLSSQMMQHAQKPQMQQMGAGAPLSQFPSEAPPPQQGAPQRLPTRPQPPPFRMMPVQSSDLHMVGYDAIKGDLHVQFKSGPDQYVYHGVKPETFEGLMKARSKGLFHANEIKAKDYKFDKVKPIPPKL